MHRFRLDILLAVLLGVALLGSSAPSRSFAADCQPASKPGFNVDSQSRGSVVTLCAHFVAVQTKPVPAKSPKLLPGPGLSTKPKTAPKPDPELARRLLHRKLARDGQSSFSPQGLIIRVDKAATLINRQVEIVVAHGAQFHTAYLLNRFASLRFIPLRIDFHFDSFSRPSRVSAFGGRVSFKKRGWHTIRGIVTYRAEYRLSGTASWVRIVGQQQVAAVAARVWVTSKSGTEPLPPELASKPLLVANDCTQKRVWVGCLN